LLPDPSLFIYFYVRKEAVLSSQIEGTQSSLSQLLLFEEAEPTGVPIDDVEEVSQYVAALYHGIRRIRGDGFPLSLRLIREIHAVLLDSGRGSDKEPGEFRTSQNWIGGSRPGNANYVPPPPDHLMECLGNLELFLHETGSPMPLLIRAALAHVQFESIHPFLDGNGRLGRLLVTLLLINARAIDDPLLYLSVYFKKHREQYYRLLQRVREESDWIGWIRFFLDGVRETANEATTTARRIISLFEADRARIQGVGRTVGSVLRIHEHLQRKPLTSVSAAANTTELSFPTARSSMGSLERLGIVSEVTGRSRNKLYAYTAYLKILEADE
jgi:Fic family protein